MAADAEYTPSERNRRKKKNSLIAVSGIKNKIENSEEEMVE